MGTNDQQPLPFTRAGLVGGDHLAAQDCGDVLCCRADRLAQRQRHGRETADFDLPAPGNP